jgi:16S rRNA (cytidine1402-2'-O)-methyltransferase
MSRTYHIGAHRFDADALATGLYLVATPIGNLADITVRALATLAAADVVLCEDTRTSGKLMARYGIKAKLEAYHEHNAAKVRPHILKRLADGAAIALISDAGTPLVSDPGYRLVAETVAQGFAVTPCPGPSAVLAGLAVSGLPTDRFLFLGFLPAKAGETRKLYDEVKSLRATLVFFESPHRIIETLEEMAEALPGRTVCVTRELTKLHEEALRGSYGEVIAGLKAKPAVKGEITLILGPPPTETHAATDADVAAAIAAALQSMPASKAAAEIARHFGLAKADVYAQILALKADG